MMKPSFLYGFFASISLLALYGTTMTALAGWNATIVQFRSLWYLMLPLSAGFGIQVGLYTMMKTQIHTRVVSASGTSAGAGMLACCAHHAADVLPFLGLSGISIFLARYQVPMLIASLIVNGVGIVFMIRHIKNL